MTVDPKLIHFPISVVTAPLVILIGPPGAGKTTVGKVLAERSGCQFMDTDGLIEQASGISIAQIFDRYGEPRFRELEFELIANLLKIYQTEAEALAQINNRGQGKLRPLIGTVLGTGAGLPVAPENFERLLLLGHVIALTAMPQVLVSRIAHSTERPLINSASPSQAEKDNRSSAVQLEEIKDRLNHILAKRQPVYAKATNVVDTSDLEVFEVVERIIDLLRHNS